MEDSIVNINGLLKCRFKFDIEIIKVGLAVGFSA